MRAATPNEKEISYGRVSWQTCWNCLQWGRRLHRLVRSFHRSPQSSSAVSAIPSGRRTRSYATKV